MQCVLRYVLLLLILGYTDTRMYRSGSIACVSFDILDYHKKIFKTLNSAQIMSL